MIVAEVLRPDVGQLDHFLVELFVLLGAVVEGCNQLYCVHGDQPVEDDGHSHAGIGSVGMLAVICQLRLVAKHVESSESWQQAL